MSGEVQKYGQQQTLRRPARVREKSITRLELAPDLVELIDNPAVGGPLTFGGLDSGFTLAAPPGTSLLTSADI